MSATEDHFTWISYHLENYIVEDSPWTASLHIRTLAVVEKAFLAVQQRLAERVRALRAERGLSQEALAHEAGIDRTYTSQLERGVANPSLKIICAVSQVLGVEPKDLIS